MEVEARGTHVRLMNKWRNLLSHCSAVWTHPLEFKLVPGLGVGTLYRSTDLTSDTTPYFHNFIHMHGDTDSLFFPSPFELPTTHILCISSHAPTLSSPLQYSQSHILHWFQYYPHSQNFKFSLTLFVYRSVSVMEFKYRAVDDRLPPPPPPPHPTAPSTSNYVSKQALRGLLFSLSVPLYLYLLLFSFSVLYFNIQKIIIIKRMFFQV